jgi:hypothetical protein
MLDRDSLLQILRHIDPGQTMWTRGNIDHILESAAPGCKGRATHEQLIAWIGPVPQLCVGQAASRVDTSRLDDSDCASTFGKQKSPSEASTASGGVGILPTCQSTAHGIPTPGTTTLLQRRKPSIIAIETKPAAIKPALANLVVDGTSDPPTEVLGLSNRERFLKQLAGSADSGTIMEPMTDTRHKVKAWGKSTSDNSMSLWARRKAEIKQISSEHSAISVEAMKLERLVDVPESPKRVQRPGRMRHQSTFDSIPEETTVKTYTDNTVVKAPGKKKTRDRNKFMSSV